MPLFLCERVHMHTHAHIKGHNPSCKHIYNHACTPCHALTISLSLFSLSLSLSLSSLSLSLALSISRSIYLSLYLSLARSLSLGCSRARASTQARTHAHPHTNHTHTRTHVRTHARTHTRIMMPARTHPQIYTPQARTHGHQRWLRVALAYAPKPEPLLLCGYARTRVPNAPLPRACVRLSLAQCSY